MISQDHPYFFLAQIFAKERAEFNLSRYVYKEDSLFDQRDNLSIVGSKLTPHWINQIVSSLQPDEELALHSKIIIKGRVLHIPMIDFAVSQLSSEIVDRMGYFLPKKIMLNLAFFDSGRSYHAYSLALLSPKEWIEFMGRLLLINPRIGPQIIDARWVGHRLIGGYCSLRWSNNTGKYVRSPSSVMATSDGNKQSLDFIYTKLPGSIFSFRE